jgi:hypothetical protein
LAAEQLKFGRLTIGDEAVWIKALIWPAPAPLCPGKPQLISQQFFLGSLQKSFRRNIFRTLAQMKK